MLSVYYKKDYLCLQPLFVKKDYEVHLGYHIVSVTLNRLEYQRKIVECLEKNTKLIYI